MSDLPLLSPVAPVERSPESQYPAGSAERWAHDYLCATDLAHKFRLAETGLHFGAPGEFQPEHGGRPGRPATLEHSARSPKTPGSDAIKVPERRARLLHTFLHHELQAAELMCWAILRFPDTPLPFRKGLLGICQDEIRHMAMYAEHIERLGFHYGAFPVNDWFWQRVPAATSPAQFVAVMGLGFEGANLDHTARFAERFRRAGDETGAVLQERVGAEEVPHVAFGVHWFPRLACDANAGPADNGGAAVELTFARWCAALPAPLSPMLMRGRPLNLDQRSQAGFSAAFLKDLGRWQPDDAPTS